MVMGYFNAMVEPERNSNTSLGTFHLAKETTRVVDKWSFQKLTECSF